MFKAFLSKIVLYSFFRDSLAERLRCFFLCLMSDGVFIICQVLILAPLCPAQCTVHEINVWRRRMLLVACPVLTHLVLWQCADPFCSWLFLARFRPCVCGQVHWQVREEAPTAGASRASWQYIILYSQELGIFSKSNALLARIGYFPWK